MILRKILFVLIGYLLVRFIYRIWKVRSALKEGFRTMQDQQRGHTPEGETRIHPNQTTKTKRKSETEGDYVDFEEVD